MHALRALLITTALAATACGSSDTGTETASTNVPTTEPDAETTTTVENKAGPIVIEETKDFASSTPAQVTGTFEVVDGADLLGCNAGALTEYGGPSGNTSQMTCEDGEREGTFTLRFQPSEDTKGPGDSNGPWTVLESSGDFAGLTGEGLWSGTIDSGVGYGSFPGTIEFLDPVVE